MRRAGLLLAAAGAFASCDLDLFGAFREYCDEHPGACDGGVAVDGGAADGGDAGEVADSGLADWCERITAARCARMLECNYPGATSCSDVTDLCARSYRPGTSRGAYRFDPRAADGCLQQLAAAPCTEVPSFTCANAFAPNSRLGELCEFTCEEGWCSGAPRVGASCPVCRAWADAGERCDTAQCAPGSSCRELDAGSFCVALRADGEPCQALDDCRSSICQPGQPDGGGLRCGPAPEGAPCDDANACAASHYCEGLRHDGASVLSPGTCVPRRALGSPCADEQLDDGCADGGSCLGGLCSAPAPLPKGAPCDAHTRCARGRCTVESFYLPDGTPLVGDGICRADQGPGETCRWSEECATGLHCEPGGTCAPALPAGAECADAGPFACGIRSCLTYVDGGQRCGTAPRDGAPCGETGACQFSFECLATDAGIEPTCVRREVGAPCAMGPGFCASFRCAPADGGGLFCAPSCFQ